MVKLYTEKTAITAADMLNDKVLPFFEKEGIPLNRMITDRGTEFCGKPDQHDFQLYLGIEDINHTKTKDYHPQTNGICERFHKTMKEECYMVIFRKKIYHSVDDLKIDADEWIRNYNTSRPHSGKHCYGKTPYQTFLDSKHIAFEKNTHLFHENPLEVHNELDTSDNSTTALVVVSYVSSVRLSLV